MKKLLLGFLLAVSAFAAGSVSQSVSPLGRSIVSGQTVVTSFVIQLQWTGDASTGSVPSTVIQNLQQLQGYQITQVQIIPNTPAPTAGYSVKITDVSGYDMLEGQAASSSATAATSYATSSKVPPIVGALNLVVTGNSVASAQGRVLVYAYKPSVIAAINLLGTGGTSGGGTVTSVFGRTGAVAATGGDYTASQVTNVPAGGIAATDVQAAITELDAEKGAGTVTVVGSGSLGSTQCVTGGGTTTLQTPSANCTVDSSGNLVANSVSTGTAPPTCTAGTAGLICLKEGTAGTGEASAALLYSKTDHLLYANLNNGGEVQVPTATSTATLTNKAFDTAGTGNSFKINGTAVSSVAGNTSKVQLAGSGTPATNDCAKFDANGNIVTAGAACGSGSSFAPDWFGGMCGNSNTATTPAGHATLPNTSAATVGCVLGLYDVISFAKSGTPIMYAHGIIPAGATGADLYYNWIQVDGGSGNVRWQASFACMTTGGNVSSPSFNANTTVTTATAAANILTSSTFTSLDFTGCAAGYRYVLRLQRDSGNGGDTYANPASITEGWIKWK